MRPFSFGVRKTTGDRRSRESTKGTIYVLGAGAVGRRAPGPQLPGHAFTRRRPARSLSATNKRTRLRHADPPPRVAGILHHILIHLGIPEPFFRVEAHSGRSIQVPDPKKPSSAFKDTRTAQASFLRSSRKAALSPG